jgi:List-Bact-rpt repeat protein
MGSTRARARLLGYPALLGLATLLIAGGAAGRPGSSPVLRVSVTGAGRVTSSDARIKCHTRCSAIYRPGKVRRLTAEPNTNFQFERWDGDCIGLAPICDVALDRNTSVRATFVGEPVELAISVGGPGKVTSVPAGITCGEGSYACQLMVPHASKVTLIPVPDSTGRFGAWDGPCSSAGSGACTVRVESPRTETAAAFGHSSPQSGDQLLTVTPYDSLVHVTSQPAGIDCPPSCGASFSSGTVVTLRLNRGLWQGACTGENLDRCALSSTLRPRSESRRLHRPRRCPRFAPQLKCR